LSENFRGNHPDPFQGTAGNHALNLPKYQHFRFENPRPKTNNKENHQSIAEKEDHKSIAI